MLPCSAWISDKRCKKELQKGGNSSREDPNQGVAFLSGCPSAAADGPESSLSTAGGGEKGRTFFFSLSKLKPPKKGKCCPCNFGRDFRLLFSLSEWQISSSILEEERGKAMAWKPGIYQVLKKDTEEDGVGGEQPEKRQGEEVGGRNQRPGKWKGEPQ